MKKFFSQIFPRNQVLQMDLILNLLSTCSSVPGGPYGERTKKIHENFCFLYLGYFSLASVGLRSAATHLI